MTVSNFPLLIRPAEQCLQHLALLRGRIRAPTPIFVLCPCKLQQIHFMMTTIKNGAATSLAYQGGTSGPGGESNGQPTLSRSLSCDDAHHRADGKTMGKDYQPRDELRIGTWNVRTLLQVASLELLIREMDRCTVQLLGISEMRWTGKGHFTTSDGHTVYFSGNEKGVRRE